MKTMRGLVLALTVACSGDPEDDTGTPCTDADNDGICAELGDCDDGSAGVRPGADERCNDVDDDCDGSVDEDALDATTWYADVDRDTHGDPASALSACERPDGYVSASTDCDDLDAATHPGAAERCDGKSNACSTTLSGEIDDDHDGYVECTIDAGGWHGASSVVGGGDCNDANATIHPAAVEIPCDGVVQQCGGADGDVFVGFGAGFAFADLQTGIDAAGMGEVVCVGEGTYYGPLVIDTPAVSVIAMEGPARTDIQGDTTGRAVHIASAPEVVLQGFRIHSATIPAQDSHGGNGAGVLVTASNHVVLSGNVIEDNTAWTSPVDADYLHGVGGGIAVDDSSGVRIEDNVVRRNAAWYGGGIGLLETSFDVVIEGNTIAHNDASDGGGMGIHDAPGALIVDNRVEDNAAAGYGGGLDLWQATGSVLDGNTFDGNTALAGGGLSLYANPVVSMSDNTLSNNAAGDAGGGAYVEDPVELDWTGGTVVSNEARQGGGVYATIALAGDASVRFASIDVTGNVATHGNGGGIVVESGTSVLATIAVTFDRVTFARNEAARDAGGLLVERSDTLPALARVVLEACTFDGNVAGEDGGGAIVRQTLLQVDVIGGTVFRDNVANRVAGGLAIEDLDVIVIDDAHFEGNVLMAGNPDANTVGGGLFAARVDDFALTDSSFVANEAREPANAWGRGGGAALQDLDASRVDGCTFADNVGDQGGGLFMWELVDPVVTDNTFTANGGAQFGGGLALWGGTGAVVSGNTFDANHSRWGGGLAMVDFASTADFSANVYTGNTASYRGGGIYLQGVTLIPISNSAFSANSGQGSDLFCWGEGSSSFTADLATTWSGLATDRRCSGCSSNVSCPAP